MSSNINRDRDTPSDMLRVESLREKLDAIVNRTEAGSLSTRTIFSGSPLQSTFIESTILVFILINAHERNVPIADAYFEVTSDTGAEYIDTFARRDGQTYQNLFRYEPANPRRIYPSEELAEWMNIKLVGDWGYLPVGIGTFANG